MKNSVPRQLREAKKLQREGKITQAIILYRELLRSFPNNQVALRELASLQRNETHRDKTGPSDNTDDLRRLSKLQNNGRHEDVINLSTKLGDRVKENSSALTLIGLSYAALGQHKLSIESFKASLERNPNFFEPAFQLGNSLLQLGNIEEAILAYERAITIEPGSAEANNNLALCLRHQGNVEQALEICKRSIQINQNFHAAQVNMGMILRDLSLFEESVEHYKKALDIQPDSAAYKGLAYNYLSLEKNAASIEAFCQALSFNGEDLVTLHGLAGALQDFLFEEPNAQATKFCIRILDKRTVVSPETVCRSILSLCRHHPSFEHLKALSHQKERDPVHVKNIEKLSSGKLLLSIMSICPINDLETEELLINLRRRILRNWKHFPDIDGGLEILKALALQCFNNEYIYPQTTVEKDLVEELTVAVGERISEGKQVKSAWVACLACYEPLYKFNWAQKLTPQPEILSLFEKQVFEPLEELELKKEIRAIGEISDRMSNKVRDQYEENPYPRWSSVGLPLASETLRKIAEQNRLKVKLNEIFDKPDLKVLVAGCGTGRHSVICASRFKNSQILAVDLSLASLAYAKRQSASLNFKNIEYRQADILSMGDELGKFDVIESGGVLHHLDEPMRGWKRLYSLLDEGGLMRIGLYSRLARQSVTKIREELIGQETKFDLDWLREKRRQIIQSNSPHHVEMRSFRDFFSTSNVRDLIFHVNEHQFTIEEIADCLSQLGLRFCGFEGNKKLFRVFSEQFPEEKSLYNLSAWSSFEKRNPSAFRGMYQFWCQKV